eukprot:gb/GECG01016463.1/.p1 GENE.gb/GECG01016463.1/~~gb/GECG01016463.1/.p1  ORF type:complete len:296 (+),score=35.24 gb/GECG01016463.1/:1-888(+)
MAFVVHGPGSDVPPPVSRNPEEAIDTLQDTKRRHVVPANFDSDVNRDNIVDGDIDLLVCGYQAGEFLVKSILPSSSQELKFQCSQHPTDIRTPSSITQRYLPPRQRRQQRGIEVKVKLVKVPVAGGSRGLQLAFVSLPPEGYASVMHDARLFLKVLRPKRVLVLSSQTSSEKSMEIDTRTVANSAEDATFRQIQREGRTLGTTSFLQGFPAALMVQAEMQRIPSLSVLAFQPLYTSLEVLRVLNTWLCHSVDSLFGMRFHTTIFNESKEERESKLRMAGQQLRTRREGSVGAMFM